MDDRLHTTLKALVEKRAVEGHQRYNDASKKKLAKICETKCKTGFIGALSQFEEFFGELWGHKDSHSLTPEQQAWKEIWNECRTAVLNNGNNQIRAINNEIQQYDITWRRHERQLPVIELPGGKEDVQREET